MNEIGAFEYLISVQFLKFAPHIAPLYSAHTRAGGYPVGISRTSALGRSSLAAISSAVGS
ncbi:MAG: hypothetical protein JKY25_08900, partial [Robiginitomaculum sp.]|nr:hypothetical protein [Robiginitomaculum sp.]